LDPTLQAALEKIPDGCSRKLKKIVDLYPDYLAALPEARLATAKGYENGTVSANNVVDKEKMQKNHREKKMRDGPVNYHNNRYPKKKGLPRLVEARDAIYMLGVEANNTAFEAAVTELRNARMEIFGPGGIAPEGYTPPPPTYAMALAQTVVTAAVPTVGQHQHAPKASPPPFDPAVAAQAYNAQSYNAHPYNGGGWWEQGNWSLNWGESSAAWNNPPKSDAYPTPESKSAGPFQKAPPAQPPQPTQPAQVHQVAVVAPPPPPMPHPKPPIKQVIPLRPGMSTAKVRVKQCMKKKGHKDDPEVSMKKIDPSLRNAKASPAGAKATTSYMKSTSNILTLKPEIKEPEGTTPLPFLQHVRCFLADKKPGEKVPLTTITNDAEANRLHSKVIEDQRKSMLALLENYPEHFKIIRAGGVDTSIALTPTGAKRPLMLKA